MLMYCSPSVVDGEPAVNQHWINVFCLMPVGVFCGYDREDLRRHICDLVWSSSTEENRIIPCRLEPLAQGCLTFCS